MKDELILIEPTMEYAEDILAYRQEFLARGDSMDGTSCLRQYEDAACWLKWVSDAKSRETCAPSWVPDVQYITLRKADGRLIGMVDIRLELNDDCLKYYGNIGYSIRPSERGWGYSTEQLRLALDISRKLGLSRVLITCDRNNLPSARTIVKNGGVLVDELYDPNDDTITQRYWIKLG